MGSYRGDVVNVASRALDRVRRTYVDGYPGLRMVSSRNRLRQAPGVA